MTNYESLPTELQLQILRWAVIADPPYIDDSGRLQHNLLKPQLNWLRTEVLDVIFHSAPLSISFDNIEEWRDTLKLSSWAESFFEFHDRSHGKDKRSGTRLEVEYDVDRELLEYGDMDTCSQWMTAMGVLEWDVEFI